jgi:hypothetical protein
MPPLLPPVISQLQTANDHLAAQIVVALLNADYITAAEKDAAMALLNTGNAKAGEWRRLLETKLPPL